ncbi:PhoX family protein [Anaerobacillus sp. MEB173]|uniref:PhoX family protein n=1 Tax=Anaerobacillus sp. MEB173 TaxID=3383345 RepID=UPI003F91790E
MDVNRRKFLTFVGTGMTAMTIASTGIGALAPKVAAADNARDSLFGYENRKSFINFKPIAPSSKDELLLPQGYSYDVVAAYGDVINQQGDTFGFNCDFTMYLPIQGSSRGLLLVNHEYTNPLYVEGPMIGGKYTPEQVHKLLYNQGLSIIEVYEDPKTKTWKMDTDSKYARRISGLAAFELTGPAAGTSAVNGATKVQGTFANCSGGATLWGTVLSCEENWETTANRAGLDTTHYGWVVEVDPFDKDDKNFKPRKHTALGRFHHENCAMGLSKDHRIVVYSGDDKAGACVYKYISKGKYNKALGKENSKLLEDGTLFAADMMNGKWLPLTIESVRELAIEKGDQEKLNKFKTQADVLVNANEAALFLGATPTDRPEDVEISPIDNSIFIAHTNNASKGNIHGHITRFFETNADLGSLTFEFEIFAAGGTQSGFSAPDNLDFDRHGNLWTVTDISSSSLNKGAHASFKNNGMFVIPTTGTEKGKAFQFASGPVEAELTGPWWTPNQKNMFLAVQHPGESTKDIHNPTSMWPHRQGDTMPRPSVVVIKGF